MRRFVPTIAGLVSSLIAIGQPSPDASPWAEFVEPDFPFFSSVLDGREPGTRLLEDNLTPRGLILNPGHGCWAAFDLDLLRVAAVWAGDAVTPVSMAQGSYHVAGRKVPEGQKVLPRFMGAPWFANGIYPGWQAGETWSLTDPRPPGPDPKEVGRGPLPTQSARFHAIRLVSDGAQLEYSVAGTRIKERFRAEATPAGPRIHRSFRLEAVDTPLWLIIGRRPAADTAFPSNQEHAAPSPAESAVVSQPRELEQGVLGIRIAKCAEPIAFDLVMDPTKAWVSLDGVPEFDESPPSTRWTSRIETSGPGSVPPTGEPSAYVIERVELPLGNPWRRNVRVSDLAFFRTGEAVVVTFDGDVWRVRGLGDGSGKVTWKRFASGFHEPLGIAIRDEVPYVHDRNGIWRLLDTDQNGEADAHELFSSIVPQTAETREFASGLRVTPDGSFIIAKGGQRGETLGRHTGSVLRIHPTGDAFEVLAYGLRQPFIGVHPLTGQVTASDQQGHYIPTTALHIIEGNLYHGFLPLVLPKNEHPAPIADPLTWIPHPINASGAGQTWVTDARMGPLNGTLIHLGYYRPEVFTVLLNKRGSRPQATVLSLARDLDFAPLAAAMNPTDGQVYIAGFQIWGTTAKDISGIARLRHTGGTLTLPRELAPMDKGVLLRFHTPLDPAVATDPANYSAERWNYRRSPDYGSPHFHPDGSKGQEVMTPSSVYLSSDGTGVFVAIPDMKPVMQMRLGWTLATASGRAFADNAYFTPYELTPFHPASEGFQFDAAEVDLTPRPPAESAPVRVDAEEGRRLAELLGCVACHSTDGSTLARVGPSWKGLFGSERHLSDGSTIIADESYLRESIRTPPARIVRGYESSDTGMPSYEGVITDPQVESLILYLKTIR